MDAVLGYVLVAILYLAGSVAAADAGWQATALLLRLPAGLARSAVIASAEAFIGLGTGLLAIVLGLWLEPERLFAFVLAATIGTAMGLARQLRRLGDARDRDGTPFEAVEAAHAENVAPLLLRELRFGGASRMIGVGAVLAGLLVQAFG